MFSFQEFCKIHRRTLLNSVSANAVFTAFKTIPRVLAWFEDDGGAWWAPADEMARELFGYVPVRLIYKDARDLPASHFEASKTLH